MPEIAGSTMRADDHVIVSCVVVAFHRPGSLASLLESLVHPRIEIIVVNVENDDRVASVTADRIVPVATNVGYAAAVNLGARSASAGVVAFMNDDLEATAQDVLTLAERITSLQADVVVPLVVGSDGEPEFAERPPYRLAERMQLKGQPVPAGPTRVDAAWASLVVVRADLLDAVPLPETYFMYWEELDWFYRLRQRLVRVEFLPTVKVQHLGGLATSRPDKSRLMARNAVRCVRSTRGRGAALRAWPHVIAWQSRLFFGSVLYGGRRGEARAHLAGVHAAIRAWREI